MHILITGGTGLIGSALISSLQQHDITVITRNSETAPPFPDNVRLLSDINTIDFNHVDAVINLAGEPIIDKRWTKEQKHVICSSRWDITQAVVDKIHAARQKPKVFISGSAVGIYGDHGNNAILESTPAARDDFPYQLCKQWEDIALKAESENTRVCLLRTGVVLSKTGGALKKMWLPYSLGLGGRIGTGEQYFPWIHIKDMVNAIVFLLTTESTSGAFNLTAPNPVTNHTFSHYLAKTLKRPHFLFTPEFAIKMALGEGSQLLLDSQRVYPERLEQAGFEFQFPHLAEALTDLTAVTS